VDEHRKSKYTPEIILEVLEEEGLYVEKKCAVLHIMNCLFFIAKAPTEDGYLL
jgi:hypothetical protein